MNVIQAIKKYKELKPKLIALAGGRSVKKFYDLIPKNGEFFLLDERLTGEKNEDLLRGYGLTFHAVEDPTKYTNELRKYSKDLIFDVLVIGVGEDGHIASLFPNHDMIESTERGYGIETNSTKPPKKRITLLPESIINSKYAFLLFMGKEKQEAYDFFKKHEPTDENIKHCPALLIKKMDYTIITDLN